MSFNKMKKVEMKIIALQGTGTLLAEQLNASTLITQCTKEIKKINQFILALVKLKLEAKLWLLVLIMLQSVNLIFKVINQGTNVRVRYC